MTLKQITYLGTWYVRALFFGRKAPLQSVIFMLDKCNLRCKHCSVYALAKPRIKTLEEIRQELEDFYKAGSRFVDFEGGELYLWRDSISGEVKTIDDVLDLAHQIGFWSATITTNAQLPFNGSHADQVWVSMDGIGQYHDMIRGEGAFARLEKNIHAFKTSQKGTPLCVNMVINNLNVDNVSDALEYVRQSVNIDAISLNFHTPFQETEELFLAPEKRNEIIDQIIAYKRKGYPIMNTVSGLKAMKMVINEDKLAEGKDKQSCYETICTNKYCWITNFSFSDGSRSPKCMGYTHHVCDRCGFSMGGEMYAMMRMKIDTLLAGMKLRT